MLKYDDIDKDSILTNLDGYWKYEANDGNIYRVWDIECDGVIYSIAEYGMEDAICDGTEFEAIDDKIAYYASYDDTVKTVFDNILGK